MSRIWFCLISVIGHCSTFLMLCIFTLVCCQWFSILLVCFTVMEGFSMVDMLCLIVLLQFIVARIVI